MRIELKAKLSDMPGRLDKYQLIVGDDHLSLTYNYDIHSDRTGITSLLNDLSECGIQIKDVQTKQSSLEEIFVDLLEMKA